MEASEISNRIGPSKLVYSAFLTKLFENTWVLRLVECSILRNKSLIINTNHMVGKRIMIDQISHFCLILIRISHDQLGSILVKKLILEGAAKKLGKKMQNYSEDDKYDVLDSEH